jgi:allophanate hydrolase subunit 2
MLADRQTTGGYTKIGVVCTVDLGSLAQRLPGQKVRFVKTTVTEAVSLLKQEAELFESLKQLCEQWRSRPQHSVQIETPVHVEKKGNLTVIVDGSPHRVEWEIIQ